MNARRLFAAGFVLLVLAGSFTDTRRVAPAPTPGILVADLHVHPFPGDGVLTVTELQHEAVRRGLDVIAVTGHNNRVALAITEAFGLLSDHPIVLHSQELTAPGFHIIAVGVRTMIDWRQTVAEAVRAIHAQGGVAIAAHPVRMAWKPMDDESLSALDGVEIAHPMARRTGSSRREMDDFLARVRAVNPNVAPIGSTDFHAAAALGDCRTYLLTADRSAQGAMDAIRQGRTVAQDRFGRLYGAAEDVAEVKRHLATRSARTGVPLLDKSLATGALLALAAALIARR